MFAIYNYYSFAPSDILIALASSAQLYDYTLLIIELTKVLNDKAK